MDGNYKIEWERGRRGGGEGEERGEGEGEERAEVDFRAASNFLFCLVFHTGECFRKKGDTLVEKNKQFYRANLLALG